LPRREEYATHDDFLEASRLYVELARPFWQSETGRAAEWQEREYVLIFDNAGGFVVKDVPPGRYDLEIDLYAKRTIIDNRTMMGGELIGTLRREILVPSVDDSADLTALDLGILELRPTGVIPVRNP
jgi:hypothetical protein